jgi:hypothetical protein
MSAMDYIDRFVAKLLIGAQVTCVAMAIINYFDWSLPPALVGLGAVLVAVVLFGMQVVLWLVRRSPRPGSVVHRCVGQHAGAGVSQDA